MVWVQEMLANTGAIGALSSSPVKVFSSMQEESHYETNSMGCLRGLSCGLADCGICPGRPGQPRTSSTARGPRPAVPPPPQPETQGRVDVQSETAAPGAANSPGGPVQGGVNLNDGAPVAGNQNPEQWRYRWHNGRWWYWTPANSWVIWMNNTWQPYSQGMFSGGYSSNYSGSYNSQPYRSYGYSSPSYGYRYSNPYYGYRSGPSFGYGYGSPRYYSGYRGYGGYGSPYGGYGGYRGSRGACPSAPAASALDSASSGSVLK